MFKFLRNVHFTIHRFVMLPYLCRRIWRTVSGIPRAIGKLFH